MGAGAPLKTPHPKPTNKDMSLNLALSLLRRGSNGSQILEILETLTAEIQQENIDDAAAHYAAISAQPTLSEVQF